MNWEYIAGFVDGEGYFGVMDYNNIKYGGRSKGKRACIHFGQAQYQHEVIFIISKFLEDKGVRHCVTTSGGKGHCLMTYIRIQRRQDCLEFLKSVRPHMVVKAKAADKIIKFCKKSLGVK